MTGDISEILRSSETVASMQMEICISNLFDSNGWNAERGIYFRDSKTRKLREIDILASRFLSGKRTKHQHGDPRINLQIVAECKDLSGHNIIVSEGTTGRVVSEKMNEYTISDDPEAKAISKEIAKGLGISEQARVLKIYQYLISRAYAFDGLSTSHHLRLLPPPVEVVAHSFRDTKGGETPKEGSSLSPLWSAITSCMDAQKSIWRHARKVSREWLGAEDVNFFENADFSSFAAWSFDSEVLRRNLSHAVIFAKARIWKIGSSGEMFPVESARISLGLVNGFPRHVDIVNFEAAEAYITSLSRHYTRAARSAIRKTSKELAEIEWQTGEKTDVLHKLLFITPKSSPVAGRVRRSKQKRPLP